MSAFNLQDFRNSVIRGDCVTIMRRMESGCVDFILTDPPYLCRYRSRDGQSIANDDRDGWLEPSFAEMYRVLRPGSLCLSFYGWNAADKFIGAWRAAGFRMVGHIVFTKRYASSTRFVQSKHEQAYLLAKGEPARPVKPIDDVRDWHYYGQSSPSNPEVNQSLAAAYRSVLSGWRAGARPVLRVGVHACRGANDGPLVHRYRTGCTPL